MPGDLHLITDTGGIQPHELDGTAPIDPLHSLLAEDALTKNPHGVLRGVGVIPQVIRRAPPEGDAPRNALLLLVPLFPDGLGG